MLKESTYQTPCGTIHYWSNNLSLDTTTLVFLPGLTADHRLFDKQVEYFDGKYNIIVWDAPAHASSWPFRFDFDLFDKTTRYQEIEVTDERLELSEEAIAQLNEKINIIRNNIGIEQKVSITYFIPDAKKAGGSYVTCSGIVKKIDEYEHTIIMTDQTVIPIEQISDIKCEEW